MKLHTYEPATDKCTAGKNKRVRKIIIRTNTASLVEDRKGTCVGIHHVSDFEVGDEFLLGAVAALAVLDGDPDLSAMKDLDQEIKLLV